MNGLHILGTGRALPANIDVYKRQELLARIRTTLRRADRLKLSRGSQKDIYHIKDLTCLLYTSGPGGGVVGIVLHLHQFALPLGVVGDGQLDGCLLYTSSSIT